MKKKPREVKIIFGVDTWYVSYVRRRKGQWHSAASFYAKDHSFEWVRNWVLTQPELLKLVQEDVSTDWQDTSKQYQAV